MRIFIVMMLLAPAMGQAEKRECVPNEWCIACEDPKFAADPSNTETCQTCFQQVDWRICPHGAVTSETCARVVKECVQAPGEVIACKSDVVSRLWRDCMEAKLIELVSPSAPATFGELIRTASEKRKGVLLEKAEALKKARAEGDEDRKLIASTDASLQAADEEAAKAAMLTLTDPSDMCPEGVVCEATDEGQFDTIGVGLFGLASEEFGSGFGGTGELRLDWKGTPIEPIGRVFLGRMGGDGHDTMLGVQVGALSPVSLRSPISVGAFGGWVARNNTPADVGQSNFLHGALEAEFGRRTIRLGIQLIGGWLRTERGGAYDDSFDVGANAALKVVLPI